VGRPEWLKKRVVAKKSPVHGRGLFARIRFRTGAYIGTFEGVPTRRDGEHVLWVIEENSRPRAIRGRNELRFLNHTKRPNAEFEGADLFALRNIQPGQEILIHYGEAWEGVEGVEAAG
jgi:SET domain-containing protein